MNKQEQLLKTLQYRLNCILLASTIISESIEDTILVPSEKLIDYKDKADAFKLETDEILNNFFKNSEVTGSTFINDMIREFESNMKKAHKL